MADPPISFPTSREADRRLFIDPVNNERALARIVTALNELVGRRRDSLTPLELRVAASENALFGIQDIADARQALDVTFDINDARALVKELGFAFRNQNSELANQAGPARIRAFLEQNLFRAGAGVPSFRIDDIQALTDPLEQALAALVNVREEEIRVLPSHPTVGMRIGAILRQEEREGRITAQDLSSALQGQSSALPLLEAVRQAEPEILRQALQSPAGGAFSVAVRNLLTAEDPAEVQAGRSIFPTTQGGLQAVSGEVQAERAGERQEELLDAKKTVNRLFPDSAQLDTPEARAALARAKADAIDAVQAVIDRGQELARTDTVIAQAAQSTAQSELNKLQPLLNQAELVASQEKAAEERTKEREAEAKKLLTVSGRKSALGDFLLSQADPATGLPFSLEQFSDAQLAQLGQTASQQGTTSGLATIFDLGAMAEQTATITEAEDFLKTLGTRGITELPSQGVINTLGLSGLGIAPTGQLGALPTGLAQTPASIQAGITAQTGFAPPTFPGLPGFGFTNVQQQTPPRDLGDFGALLQGAAGDSPGFLQFLLGQLPGLQRSFGTLGRRQVREERARLQQVGVGLSEAQSSLGSALGAVGGAEGPGGEFIESETNRIQQLIGTTSQLGRMVRPSGTFEDFFATRLGGLRETFGQTPAGLQETAQAESDRRRLLRGGGRTTFLPALGA